MTEWTGSDPAATARGMEEASAAAQRFGAEARDALRGVSEEYRNAARDGEAFGRKLSRSFEDVALKGKSLSGVLRNLALDMSRMVLDKALDGVTGAIGSGVGSALSSLVTSADGNVFAGGRVKPFAKGGVISSPMLFPLQNGVGLAGEAGPEAVMPLTRGPDGRLGVASQGGGQAVNVTFNVQATDAASFRRSETQLAAMMQRVARRGTRNM
ncbi:phage tail tape measure protein [Parvibaculum sp. MBR-TMA-1.3b-4.2]